MDGQCRDATIIAVPQTKADYQRQEVLDPQVWKPVGARDRLLLVQGDKGSVCEEQGYQVVPVVQASVWA